MGKVSKNKMVLKQCPKCDYQVPVACKLCRCGHGFFSKRLLQPSMEGGEEDSNGVKRRRTERVKRERPDYYSASEYESQLRRMSTSSKSGEKEEKSKKKKRHRRGRPKGSQNKSIDQIEEEREKDLYSNLPREKTLIYSIVLAEINEKMQSQMWKPTPSDQEQDTINIPTTSKKLQEAT